MPWSADPAVAIDTVCAQSNAAAGVFTRNGKLAFGGELGICADVDFLIFETEMSVAWILMHGAADHGSLIASFAKFVRQRGRRVPVKLVFKAHQAMG